jgi:hypothetical protein
VQSRLSSLIEQVLNVASGFIISLIVWQTVGPLMGYSVTLGDNLIITAIFTVVSIIRGYLWRRYFNGRIARAYASRPDTPEQSLGDGPPARPYTRPGASRLL